LTTFRRDGTAVATPVWFVADGGTLLVWTGESTWKVKRLRHDPHVEVAICDFRGRELGPRARGSATIDDDTEHVLAYSGPSTAGSSERCVLRDRSLPR
jgi:uncharacterized protein